MPELFRRLHRRYAASDGITRRDMMQRSLAAAAGVLLSERLGALSAQGKSGRVVVIGGGFSGLAAAYELRHRACPSSSSRPARARAASSPPSEPMAG